MATQARSYDVFEEAGNSGLARPDGSGREKADHYQLRPVPNEEIYFKRKLIDNSRVVRQADPQAGARCWRWVATTSLATLFAVLLLLPDLYGLQAGLQIESLRDEQSKLLAQRAEVDVQEASLLSPENLTEMAEVQEFVDPSPEQVVHLRPASDGSLAWNNGAK